jgi:hypothetical protein
MSSIDYERYVFRLIKQEVSESFGSFIERLENQLKKCRYNDPESQFKDQIIEKCGNNALRRKAFEAKMTLDQLIFTGKTIELAEISCMRRSSRNVESPELREVARDDWKKREKSLKRERKDSRDRSSTSTEVRSRSRESQHKCTRCGSRNHAYYDQNCSARDHRCRMCKKYGHYEEFCYFAPLKTASRKTRSPEKRGNRIETVVSRRQRSNSIESVPRDDNRRETNRREERQVVS